MCLTAYSSLALSATVAVALACSADFPNEPDSAITLEPVTWPSELHVSDEATLEIRVRLRDSPQTVTGLRVQWRSSNDDVLRVVQLQPKEGASLEDTLVAQRQAVVTARSGGIDTVHVVVGLGSGFEPAESTFVVRVTQKWKAVSAGRAHTCAITVDSLAYCWGQGDAGKLGTGRPIASLRPGLVLGLGDLKFIAVSAGDESSCGIIREHVAYCWGSNAEGRLGNGDPSERSQFLPTPVSGPSMSSLDVGRVACGLGEDLVAFCWGANVDDQLGAFGPPPLDPCLNNNSKGCSLTPRMVTPSDTTPGTYRRVSVGGHHVCGLSQAPDSLLAFCWGRGPFGALGNAAVTSSPTPVPVAGNLKFVVIVAGEDHTCALATSGATYCWGANGNGQLGNGSAGDVGTPDAVTPGDFDSLTAGGQHTCALTGLGEASCWGLGTSGQLGDGSAAVRFSPVPVSDGHRFTALSAGDSHTCGVTLDGSLYCWGQGTEGQLGTGDLANHTTPTRVAEP